MPVLCSVCQHSEFRYTCPRCEVVYCSISCYTQHSTSCTERFYQQQVEEELHSRQGGRAERQRLEAMVTKLNRLDVDGGSDDENDDADPVTDRLELLAEKADAMSLDMGDLTEDEIRRFHSELKRGTLGQTLGAWEPWWQRAGISEAGICQRDHLCCGERTANPSVAWAVLETIYAYAHMMRAFNGDCSWDYVQAAVHFAHIAVASCTRTTYGTPRESLRRALSAAASLPGTGFGATFDRMCLHDVATIIEGGADFCWRASEESSEVLAKAADSVNCGKPWKKLWGASKKTAFFASFAFHHHGDLLPLAACVRHVAGERENVEQERVDMENRRAHGGLLLPEMD